MQRLMLKAVLMLAGFVLPIEVYAAWSSGGGELIKDAHNPWFIQNTKHVTYCIERDKEHFKLNENEGFPLDILVKKAIAYWQTEFATALIAGNMGKDQVKVASQQFFRQSCSEATDLKFQFGFLSAAQKEEMNRLALDPKGYVSLAVRTSYDQTHLKAKGFIYLAADSGPLRPNSDEMLEHPWAEGSGGNIYKILVHELGHVFGIPHQSSFFNIMGSEYPESVVNKISADKGYSYFLPSFFKFSQSLDSTLCYGSGPLTLMAKFFDLPADSNCYSLKYVDEELQVWASADIHSEMLHIGTARFEGKDDIRVEPVVTLWLPDQQTVYPANPDRHGRVLYGTFIQHSHRKGLYKTVSGQIERQVSVIQSPSFQWNKIGGILDGKLLINVQASE